MRRTIRKSAAQRLEAKAARFFASLTAESEFVGVTGVGHPASLYKVFVRAAPRSRWWRLEVTAGPTTAARLPTGPAVRGRVADLAAWSFMPEREAIGRLFERARELGAQ